MLSLHDAASMLGVHHSWVSRKLKKVGIFPINKTAGNKKRGNTLLFKREEIEAVAKSTEAASIEEVRHSSLKAGAQTSLLEQRVDLLEYMLGMRAERLPLDEDSVIVRYKKARRLADSPHGRITARGALDWARFFLAVTEEYFSFMENVLKKEDPWFVFMELGERISLAFHKAETHDPEVLTAYGCLEAGRKNLRTVCYARSARKYGLPVAIEHVPLARDGDVDAEIIAIILSREVTCLHWAGCQKEA